MGPSGSFPFFHCHEQPSNRVISRDRIIRSKALPYRLRRHISGDSTWETAGLELVMCLYLAGL